MSVTKIMSTKLPTVVEHDHADRQWHDLVGREAAEDARGALGGRMGKRTSRHDENILRIVLSSPGEGGHTGGTPVVRSDHGHE